MTGFGLAPTAKCFSAQFLNCRSEVGICSNFLLEPFFIAVNTLLPRIVATVFFQPKWVPESSISVNHLNSLLPISTHIHKLGLWLTC
ncbi:hypothetical protein SAMN04489842_2189 [Natronobacterium texcoconense]|uniref:Uncharacterized protein n=1 Tax=Natronobacterium texcoconense TaxID=1095778 RepID=A0A1H1FZR1_NATTX|nr:hypothetical protein SAMN04489842_2189 [Natronobacterium texcoconense]